MSADVIYLTKYRIERHPPASTAAVASESRRLAADGWTKFGTGQVLRLDLHAVQLALANMQRAFMSQPWI